MADYHKKAVTNHETAKNNIKEVLESCFGEDYIITTEDKLGTPDFAFRVDITMENQTTLRKLFFEVKTKGTGGNAHERAYRSMMPGTLERLRQVGNWGYQDPKIVASQYIIRPIIVVFCGECLKVDRFRAEIKELFSHCIENYLLLDLETPQWQYNLESHIRKYYVTQIEEIKDI